MKEKLEELGWTCAPCNCPGRKRGYDCANKNFRGVMIKTWPTMFRIYKNSMLVETAHGYELEEKLKMHQII